MQIILVHTITKFYYSSPSYCREMQGDAKLHTPPRNVMFRDWNRVNESISPMYHAQQSPRKTVVTIPR